jgi:Trk-type K+ transport system membrane component
LPISLQHPGQIVVEYGAPPEDYWFSDALFVSCSALSDTGLTPAVLSETYTFFGQFVILCLMEMGGIGLMTIIFLV